MELPHQVAALNDNVRLVNVLTNQNVFDRLNRPESEMQLIALLHKCGGYSLAMKMYEEALLTRWLYTYLPADDGVSTLVQLSH